jgi:hypothetical protein
MVEVHLVNIAVFVTFPAAKSDLEDVASDRAPYVKDELHDSLGSNIHEGEHREEFGMSRKDVRNIFLGFCHDTWQVSGETRVEEEAMQTLEHSDTDMPEDQCEIV